MNQKYILLKNDLFVTQRKCRSIRLRQKERIKSKYSFDGEIYDNSLRAQSIGSLFFVAQIVSIL